MEVQVVEPLVEVSLDQQWGFLRCTVLIIADVALGFRVFDQVLVRAEPGSSSASGTAAVFPRGFGCLLKHVVAVLSPFILHRTAFLLLAHAPGPWPLAELVARHPL